MRIALLGPLEVTDDAGPSGRVRDLVRRDPAAAAGVHVTWEKLKITLLDRTIEPYVTAGIYTIDQWRQIGVTVEHQELELASYYSSISGRNYDAVIDSYTDYVDDPTTGLPKFLSADKWPVASG